MEVTVQNNESLERALRRFKRKVQRSGLYSELRKRRFYEKPSAQRKRKREAAIRRGASSAATRSSLSPGPTGSHEPSVRLRSPHIKRTWLSPTPCGAERRRQREGSAPFPARVRRAGGDRYPAGAA